MQEDEDITRRPGAFGPAGTPPVLDRWDIEDLHAYIAALRAEILRAEAAVAVRQAQRSAADSIFRRG